MQPRIPTRDARYVEPPAGRGQALDQRFGVELRTERQTDQNAFGAGELRQLPEPFDDLRRGARTRAGVERITPRREPTTQGLFDGRRRSRRLRRLFDGASGQSPRGGYAAR
jgi:hypothetical protein